MSERTKMQETAVSDPEAIDDLKQLEKEKLSAAEEIYKKRRSVQAVNEPPMSEQAVINDPRGAAGHYRRKNAWIPGAILIAGGILFLLNNITGFTIHNWWALFILIPAIGSFSKAADTIGKEDGFTREAWSSISFGIFMTLIASIFLFDLDWALIWPAFLIIGGLGLLIGGLKSW